jgi:hypothetical protein
MAKRGRPRKYPTPAEANRVRQQRHRDKVISVTPICGGPPKQPLSNTSAVNAAAHGWVSRGGEARFLQNPDRHGDVLFIQTLAGADDARKEKLLAQLHKVARALVPLQAKAHPEATVEEDWERALARAFEILNGVQAPQGK